MEIFVYRHGSQAVEEGFGRDDLPELLADETNVIWVDLMGETEEGVAEAKDILLNVFNFHPIIASNMDNSSAFTVLSEDDE